MTKRFLGLALGAAAAVSFALPAAPANAAGCLDQPATFIIQCVRDSAQGAVADCVSLGTFPLVCLSDIVAS